MSYMTGVTPPGWYTREPDPPPRVPFHKTTQFFVICVLVACAVFISAAATLAAALVF